MPAFHENLLAKIKASGLSRTDFAKKYKIHYSNLTMWCKGGGIKDAALAILAKQLHTTPEKLIGTGYVGQGEVRLKTKAKTKKQVSSINKRVLTEIFRMLDECETKEKKVLYPEDRANICHRAYEAYVETGRIPSIQFKIKLG